MPIAPILQALVQQHAAHVLRAAKPPRAANMPHAPSSGLSYRALSRLMIEHIPNLHSSALTPNARTLQDFTVAPAERLGAGMQGQLGGRYLTRSKGNKITTKP